VKKHRPNVNIAIKGLRATGFHGVFPEERRDGQDFVVDVRLSRPVPVVDQLFATIDYSSVAQTIVDQIAGQPRALIETLAAQIADQLLADRPSLSAVRVRVHKPQAPMDMRFDDVTCTLTRHRKSCPATSFVLSLGANLGSPATALRQAINCLSTTPGIDIDACSDIYRTTPVEISDATQPDYYNLVAIGSTTLDPRGLLDKTSTIEHALGRERPYPHAPRTIDIDLIDVGGARIDEPDLTLPHPRAWRRAFVVLPWLDIAPEASLPQGRLADLAEKLGNDGVTRLSVI